MEVDYVNLDYSKKQFLTVLYSSILEEIEGGLSHGTIVRHLVKDGYKLTSAEDLYQYIANRIPLIKELIQKMINDLHKIKLEYEENQSRQLQRIQSDNRNREMEREKELERYKELAITAGLEILKRIISAVLGVPG